MWQGQGSQHGQLKPQGSDLTIFSVIPVPGLAKERVNTVIGSLIVRFMNFHVSACKLNVAFSMRVFFYTQA